MAAGGQRNWVQVLANGGVPTLLAALHIAYRGFDLSRVSFADDFVRAHLVLAFVGYARSCSRLRHRSANRTTSRRGAADPC